MSEIGENINISVERYLNSAYEKYRNYDRVHFCRQIISPYLQSKVSVLDVGCAKGELIYFLKEQCSEASYTGLEYDPRLVEIAKNEQKLMGSEFLVGDARNLI